MCFCSGGLEFCVVHNLKKFWNSKHFCSTKIFENILGFWSAFFCEKYCKLVIFFPGRQTVVSQMCLTPQERNHWKKDLRSLDSLIRSRTCACKTIQANRAWILARVRRWIVFGTIVDNKGIKICHIGKTKIKEQTVLTQVLNCVRHWRQDSHTAQKWFLCNHTDFSRPLVERSCVIEQEPFLQAPENPFLPRCEHRRLVFLFDILESWTESRCAFVLLEICHTWLIRWRTLNFDEFLLGAHGYCNHEGPVWDLDSGTVLTEANVRLVLLFYQPR